jgi:hypothetical protein
LAVRSRALTPTPEVAILVFVSTRTHEKAASA